MKITGYTERGYLVEMHPSEIASLGNDEKLWIHSSTTRGEGSHPIGKEIPVVKLWEHIKRLGETVAQRASIANSLRAAATLIENTPCPVSVENPSPEDVLAGKYTLAMLPAASAPRDGRLFIAWNGASTFSGDECERVAAGKWSHYPKGCQKHAEFLEGKNEGGQFYRVTDDSIFDLQFTHWLPYPVKGKEGAE